MSFIPLTVPDLDQGDIDAVVAVLRSGMLVQGEQVLAFEREVADYLGVRHAVAVSNGTASLHLALVALGIGPGDEVIVPAFSYVATANVVELVGARCVFVDVQRETFNIDPAAIEGAMTDRTRAVIAVHEFGLACDIAEVIAIADRNGITVIEDAACALGATENGRRVGSAGKVGSFSLHPRKAVTSGEGGLLTTDDDALARQFRILRNHGIETCDGRMDFVAAGFNYRMTDIQAALVRGQFGRIEVTIAQRRRLAAAYNEALGGESWLTLPTMRSDKSHTWQTYHPVLDASIDRDRIITELRQAGVGSNYGAQCIPAQTYYRNSYNLDLLGQFPNAMRAYSRGIALPLYGTMTKAAVEKVAASLKRIALGCR